MNLARPVEWVLASPESNLLKLDQSIRIDRYHQAEPALCEQFSDLRQLFQPVGCGFALESVMAEIYSILQTDGVTRVTFFSNPEMADILQAQEAASKLINAGHRLGDFRNVNLDKVSPRRAADNSRSLVKAPSKIAILVNSDLSFGLSRMHDACRTDKTTQVRTFRDETEAIDWLNLS